MVLLPQEDHLPHPVQKRRVVARLRLDVDDLVAEEGVADDGEVELLEVRAGEAGVAVGRPLHGGAHAVAVAEVYVVAHPDLVAVIKKGRAGKAEEHGVEELYAAVAVVEQRREAAADAEVEAHAPVFRVLVIEVVALLVRHHLQSQFVVVAEEHAPLAVRGDVGRAL